MGYSTDLRMKVILFLENGGSLREAAAAFSINPWTVNKWNQMYKKTGSVDDKPRRSYFRKLDPEKLKEHIENHPDAYLSEIGEVFGCSSNAVMKAFRRLKITRKKNQEIQRTKGRAGS